MDMVGKAYLSMGYVANLAGDTDGAVVYLTRAQQLIDREESPFLFANCQHNLTDYLVKAGHFEEADLRVPIVRRLWQEMGHFRALLRLRWLEAFIQRGRGNLEAAITIFQELAWAFEQNQSPFDVALVQLDLANVFASEGRLAELEELAKEAFDGLSARGVHKEALRALGLLRDAAVTRTVTLQLLEEVARRVSQSKSNPTFSGPSSP